jgi:Protein of unknown function (DUF1566)
MRNESGGEAVLLAIRRRRGDRPRPQDKFDVDVMRCSYGQTWRKGGGCGGQVQPVDWDAAMALRVPDDAAWRLPTKEELDSIVESDCKKPAIDEEVFPGTALMAYWTSTPSGPSYAWHVNFRWGISAWQYLRSNQYAVRFVRNDR